MVNFYLINFFLASTAIFSAIVALGLFVYVIYNHSDSVVTRSGRNAQISDIRSQIPMESMGLESMSKPKRQAEYDFETIEQPSSSTTEYSSYETIEPLAEKIIVHPECHSSDGKC
ncbi:unnamed protein product [Bursaphelenchus xylophilus]|uniref:(pine wood nematode) hypothetical protein n=1 Tax=Bursaphelenchus xylophilus TaxID=6326 RepID=A0A1I7RY67_BURXY|nr:unnamed protein product [Bursaphelenchus xylophilus]CAG9085356.1 unnamed protein product [Bursaphelenchus xylophilus]